MGQLFSIRMTDDKLLIYTSTGIQEVPMSQHAPCHNSCFLAGKKTPEPFKEEELFNYTTTKEIHELRRSKYSALLNTAILPVRSLRILQADAWCRETYVTLE